ncbi:MAG: hypothetical protein DDG60_11725 [Anaerolineae bacterium]|nr:MAG: hypothetical protein DDG60_11725 [Anaerolineae bacterium]
MISIQPLDYDDCKLAANAHITYLNSSLKGQTGIQILEYHYKSMITQKGAAGYVAKMNGQFAGYICGVWEPTLFRRQLLFHAPALMFYVAKYILENPHIVIQVFRRLIEVHELIFRRKKPNRSSFTAVNHSYELRPIVVLPEFRGTGIAEALVERLIQDAKERGFNQIFLLTEHDNLPAIRFYTRFGFLLEKEVQLHIGTPYATTGKLFRYYIHQ